MTSLFLGLTIANLVGLFVTAGLGYANSGRHTVVAVIATIACCAVHCVVFTYFIATAKWVQHAVAVKGLPEDLNAPTRSFKRQAFPAALLAMGAVFLTAVMGVITESYQIGVIWHHLMAMMMIAVNIGAAVAEYRAIAGNGRLIDEVLAQASAAR